MIKRLTLLLWLIVVVSATLVVRPAYADSTGCGSSNSSSSGQAKQGLNLLSGVNDPAVKNNDTTSPQCSGSQVKGVIAAAVSLLSYVIGVAAIIMLLVTAYKYISSGGDSNKVASAKKTLIYVIVGLLVAALAQFIVHTALRAAVNVADPAACPTNKKIKITDSACKQ